MPPASDLPTAAPDALNVARWLLDGNAGRADRLAYVDDRTSLSHGELDSRCRRFAAALDALDLRREERALLLMQDTTAWPVAFLGSLLAGVVPVAVNTLLTADDYAYMLLHGRARAAFVSAALLPVLAEAIGKAGGHELQCIVVDGDTAPPDTVAGVPTRRFEALLAGHAPRDAAAPTRADDAAFWLYSSGSTGRPKGTVHTHGNAWWTAELYGRRVLALTEDDVCFSAAKLYFAYGLGNGLTFPLACGAATVLMPERPTPDAVFRRWTATTAAGAPSGAPMPTVFFGAPTGFAGMLAHPGLPARDAVALRLASSAGEALPADIGERFRRHFGVDIVDGIGSTEMLHIFLSNTPGNVRYGTTGKPVPGYAVELRGDDGRPVGDGEIGDLYIRGPSAALLYWGDRARTQATFQGTWTRSGDKYVRDAEGWYTYAGRSDDMLKVSGIYVSPFEVEATLMQHDAVLEAAVIGVEDVHGLTKTKAFVVTKSDRTATEDELKAFVKERLAPHKYPRQIVFLDELPKTATGKIQRYRLRDLERAAGAAR